jgi:hypothetical protein
MDLVGRRRKNRYRFMHIESRFAFALTIIASALPELQRQWKTGGRHAGILSQRLHL